jgi:hypothetical protein
MRDQEEEELCDRFAAELLMPRERLDLVLGSGASWSLLPMLAVAERFRVPFTAVARRLIQELQVLSGTCVIVQGRVAEGWRANSTRPRGTPQSGHTVVAPLAGNPRAEVSEIISSSVVSRVSALGAYSNGFVSVAASGQVHLVEAAPLGRIPPRNGLVCLLHDSNPGLPRVSLFDNDVL